MARKLWLAAALAAFVAAPLTPAPVQAQERFMVLGGGSTGGVYFIVMAGFARIIEKHVPNTRVTAQVTSGSIENIRLLGQKRVDCAISSTDAVYNAVNQAGPFEKEKYDNIRYLVRGYSSIMHSVVPADSPIKTLADIKGKRVGLLIGVTAQDWFPAIAAAYGLKQGEDFRVSVLRVTELFNALRDGNVDISIYVGGAPVSTVSDIATSRPVRFIPVGDAEMETILKPRPYFAKGPLAKGLYPGLTEDVPSLHVPNIFVCREDVPADVVYGITKALIENADELKQIHPEAASFANPDNIGKSVIAPVHPGAARYFTEKGLKVGS